MGKHEQLITETADRLDAIAATEEIREYLLSKYRQPEEQESNQRRRKIKERLLKLREQGIPLRAIARAEFDLRRLRLSQRTSLSGQN